ncbi:MAG: hypothetical protein IPP88_12490 [Betaproteobacteria bacterium]|nr:hypothetical protein [Betaproteobacteria bacterium]
MALFGLFGGNKKGYPSPWLQLTVVYATAREGLQPDDAFALRGKIVSAHPIGFEFMNADSFVAFYPGNASGLEAGTQLAETLRGVARDKSLPAFGVAVLQGECLAQVRGSGRFVAKPVGTVISQAMKLAIEQAESDA